MWAGWRLSGAELAEAKRDAALVWLKEQEDAGIDIVSDGEQFRMHFVHGFLEQIEGIDWNRKTKMGIRDNRYEADVPTVTGPMKRRKPIHVEEVRFTRAHTQRKLKFTLPGPMTICDTIADAHYGRRADMAMAFAKLLNEEAREIDALGVDVIQFDEPAFNVFMNDVKEWGIAALEAPPRSQLQDRGAHLLRLRHRGQHQMEGNARLRMAAIRGDFPRHQCQPHRSGVARSARARKCRSR